MSEESNTKTMLLTIIAIALVAVLGVMFYQMNDDTPAEEVAESIDDAQEDVSDAIDDAQDDVNDAVDDARN